MDMNHVLTRRQAHLKDVLVMSAEEQRRQRLEYMSNRQELFRSQMADIGYQLPSDSDIQFGLFEAFESVDFQASMTDLYWILIKFGRLMRKAILRKHTAGLRKITYAIGPGFCKFFLFPLFLRLGCSQSPDGSVLGMTDIGCIKLFQLVGIDLSYLEKDERAIRLHKTKLVEISHGKDYLSFYFYIEKASRNGSFSER